VRNGDGRRRHLLSGQILALGSLPLETVHGPFRAHVGRNLATGSVALAVTRGDFTSAEPLLVRIHSSCVTSETFGGRDCDCVEQLDAALARIAAMGRGVVFYLMQEGRGAGFAAKARDRMLVQASGNRLTTFEAYARMGLERDHRRYDEVAFLCRLLGVRAPLTLLTSNPEKLAALRGATGLAIPDAVPVAQSPSPWNHHYIAAKSRSGHRLADPGEASAASALPEAVDEFEPYALADAPRFVHVATYLLPIRSHPAAANGDAGAPIWFRLHAYYDLVSRADRVVLEHGPRAAATPLVRIERESLLARFPLARATDGGARKALWHEAVRRIAEAGAGCATVVPAIGFDDALRERNAALGPSLALLARHVRGSRVRLLVGSGGARAADEERFAARSGHLLAEAGVDLAAPVAIGFAAAGDGSACAPRPEARADAPARRGE